MGKPKGGGGSGGGKISAVKRNNKNVTKLERQGKVNRKSGKRGAGGGKKKTVDKKLARQKESDAAHRKALKDARLEEDRIGGGTVRGRRQVCQAVAYIAVPAG